MKNPIVCFILASMFFAAASAVRAENLWTESFPNVKNWTIVSDPGEGSTITSSGGIAALYVDKGKNQAAFAPLQSETTMVPFDPKKASEYTITWKIDHLTYSVGWDLAMDELDANRKYINTVWNIYPVNGNCASIGEFSKNLGGYIWKPWTKYIALKIDVYTGDPNQTVYVGYIKIDRVKKTGLGH